MKLVISKWELIDAQFLVERQDFLVQEHVESLCYLDHLCWIGIKRHFMHLSFSLRLARAIQELCNAEEKLDEHEPADTFGNLNILA